MTDKINNSVDIEQEEARDILNVLLALILIIAMASIYLCWWSDECKTVRGLHESKIAPRHVAIPSVGIR